MMAVDSKDRARINMNVIDLMISGASYIMNKLTHHGMLENLKSSPKCILTQQIFNTCIFESPFWVTTEY